MMLSAVEPMTMYIGVVLAVALVLVAMWVSLLIVSASYTVDWSDKTKYWWWSVAYWAFTAVQIWYSIHHGHFK